MEGMITNPREFLKALYCEAVHRALPAHAMAGFLPSVPTALGAKTLVIGAGKAAGAMAHALEAQWPSDAPLQGMVITRYGHTPARPAGLTNRIAIVEAAHPVPDAAGMLASQRMMDGVRGLTKDDLVICLMSGGASALLTYPAAGLSLEDKQRINRELLGCGAAIAEMNCVRKHLSQIKGGRLAAACAPARVYTLAISDVPGDDPATIGSGPTVGDETTCADALEIIRRYGITVPAAIENALQQGQLETPKPSTAVFQGHVVHVIATARQSLEAAATMARKAGVQAYILSDEIEGESREVGKVHAALARAAAKGLGPFVKPCVLLSGGETTVTLKPVQAGPREGRGGRAGEFCLGLAQALQACPQVHALAADTDGIDGVEDNAGAWVQPDTLARATALGMKIEDYLSRNDAYGFFEPLGDLLVTGPTHTNVNDFRAIYVE